jgi:ADP-sugar diphosphatase
MSSFNLPFKAFYLPNVSPTVEVKLAPNITKDQLLAYKPFNDWLATLQSSLALQDSENHPFKKEPYTLREIEIQAVDWFGPHIGFIKFKTVVENEKKERLPGGVFMRGGSVAMLMILRPKDARDERWVIMTEQPRIPAGGLMFKEIPAGMIDADTFTGAAAKEILEETGLIIPIDELKDLTALALQSAQTSEKLQAAMYPTPGGSDEFIKIFLWEKEMEPHEIEEMKDKLTGERAKGEKITVRLCDYEDLWKEGARDAKTLAAWALYEGLRREGLKL